MIIDRLENAEAYMVSGELREAFSFLRGLGVDTPEGEHEIRGRRIFARVMRYQSIPREQGKLESHRRYADIQVLLSGKEFIEWVPVEGSDDAFYDSEADVSFHPVPESAHGLFMLTPGLFALFLPGDAHMPMLQAGQVSGPVTKVVIKVEAGLFSGGVLD